MENQNADNKQGNRLPMDQEQNPRNVIHAENYSKLFELFKGMSHSHLKEWEKALPTILDYVKQRYDLPCIDEVFEDVEHHLSRAERDSSEAQCREFNLHFKVGEVVWVNRGLGFFGEIERPAQIYENEADNEMVEIKHNGLFRLNKIIKTAPNV
ncbi:hypothetical protein [Gilvibacter sp.]|uniref:hypothetical protein n=1 Tax=Gilvibacter sp. TaxID=2729997 RepID=UPI0025BFD684|nr:hypothetical protein [Gilvibacter sp.]NQX77506.1 hypothetical protein [Gilvibacter sp.]